MGVEAVLHLRIFFVSRVRNCFSCLGLDFSGFFEQTKELTNDRSETTRMK
jgi:hypothetical protein